MIAEQERELRQLVREEANALLASTAVTSKCLLFFLAILTLYALSLVLHVLRTLVTCTVPMEVAIKQEKRKGEEWPALSLPFSLCML